VFNLRYPDDFPAGVDIEDLIAPKTFDDVKGFQITLNENDRESFHDLLKFLLETLELAT